MQSPDLLFAPLVSGHCIGDERSFSVPLLYLWISDTATFGIMEFGSYGVGKRTRRGSSLSLHDDITVISTKHAERD